MGDWGWANESALGYLGGISVWFRGGIRDRGGLEVLSGEGPGAHRVQEWFERMCGEGWMFRLSAWRIVTVEGEDFCYDDL